MQRALGSRGRKKGSSAAAGSRSGTAEGTAHWLAGRQCQVNPGVAFAGRHDTHSCPCACWVCCSPAHVPCTGVLCAYQRVRVCCAVCAVPQPTSLSSGASSLGLGAPAAAAPVQLCPDACVCQLDKACSGCHTAVPCMLPEQLLAHPLLPSAEVP